MNPWIIIALATAGAVYVVDFLLRRKKWKDNSKQEKISLLVNMFSVCPYIFLSVLGMLWGIAAGSPETDFGMMLFEATLVMGATYYIVAAATVILTFLLRKKGKTKASIWINIIAMMYIVAVLSINSLAGKIL